MKDFKIVIELDKQMLGRLPIPKPGKVEKPKKGKGAYSRSNNKLPRYASKHLQDHQD